MGVETTSERRAGEPERQLTRRGEGHRTVEEVRDDDAESAIDGSLRGRTSAKQTQGRGFEDERRTPFGVEEAIGEIVIHQRLVGSPGDSATTEEVELTRGDGLLNKRGFKRREISEAPPCLIDREGAVRIEAELDRGRQLAPEDQQGLEVSLESGVVARAELDLEDTEPASEELIGAPKEIGGVRRRDEQAVDLDGVRRVITAEDVGYRRAATLTGEIEERRLQRKTSRGMRADVQRIERGGHPRRDGREIIEIEIERTDAGSSALQRMFGDRRVIDREAGVRGGLSLADPPLFIGELEQDRAPIRPRG